MSGGTLRSHMTAEGRGAPARRRRPTHACQPPHTLATHALAVRIALGSPWPEPGGRRAVGGGGTSL